MNADALSVSERKRQALLSKEALIKRRLEEARTRIRSTIHARATQRSRLVLERSGDRQHQQKHADQFTAGAVRAGLDLPNKESAETTIRHEHVKAEDILEKRLAEARSRIESRVKADVEEKKEIMKQRQEGLVQQQQTLHAEPVALYVNGKSGLDSDSSSHTVGSKELAANSVEDKWIEGLLYAQDILPPMQKMSPTSTDTDTVDALLPPMQEMSDTSCGSSFAVEYNDNDHTSIDEQELDLNHQSTEDTGYTIKDKSDSALLLEQSETSGKEGDLVSDPQVGLDEYLNVGTTTTTTEANSSTTSAYHVGGQCDNNSSPDTIKGDTEFMQKRLIEKQESSQDDLCIEYDGDISVCSSREVSANIIGSTVGNENTNGNHHSLSATRSLLKQERKRFEKKTDVGEVPPCFLQLSISDADTPKNGSLVDSKASTFLWRESSSSSSSSEAEVGASSQDIPPKETIPDATLVYYTELNDVDELDTTIHTVSSGDFPSPNYSWRKCVTAVEEMLSKDETEDTDDAKSDAVEAKEEEDSSRRTNGTTEWEKWGAVDEEGSLLADIVEGGKGVESMDMELKEEDQDHKATEKSPAAAKKSVSFESHWSHLYDPHEDSKPPEQQKTRLIKGYDVTWPSYSESESTGTALNNTDDELTFDPQRANVDDIHDIAQTLAAAAERQSSGRFGGGSDKDVEDKDASSRRNRVSPDCDESGSISQIFTLSDTHRLGAIDGLKNIIVSERALDASAINSSGPEKSSDNISQALSQVAHPSPNTAFLSTSAITSPIVGDSNGTTLEPSYEVLEDELSILESQVPSILPTSTSHRQRPSLQQQQHELTVDKLVSLGKRIAYGGDDAYSHISEGSKGSNIEGECGGATLDYAKGIKDAPTAAAAAAAAANASKISKEQRYILIVVAIALVACVAIVVGFAVAGKEKSPALSTGADEGTISSITRIVTQVSEQKLFSDHSSPQNQALTWLTEVDRHQLPLNNQLTIQRYVLALLYMSTSGGLWKKRGIFLDKYENECNWSGVDCVDGLVISLKLVNTNLVGSLPMEISRLETLQSLDLSMNELSGTLPSSLKHLSELVHLDLSGNLFEGKVPDDIFPSLSELETCYLEGNDFFGEIPPSACSLFSGHLKFLSADCSGPDPEIECSCCSSCL